MIAAVIVRRLLEDDGADPKDYALQGTRWLVFYGSHINSYIAVTGQTAHGLEGHQFHVHTNVSRFHGKIVYAGHNEIDLDSNESKWQNATSEEIKRYGLDDQLRQVESSANRESGPTQNG